MPDRPSKSARKREYQALQVLGENLIELSEQQLAGIPLDEDLRDAIVAARAIKSHSALRRQRQLIGKLMARVDAEPIREAYEALQTSDRTQKAVFRQSEAWRDRIIKEGLPAISELCETLGRDTDTLAALLTELNSCHDDAGRKKVTRQLFRAIHAELESGVQRSRS